MQEWLSKTSVLTSTNGFQVGITAWYDMVLSVTSEPAVISCFYKYTVLLQEKMRIMSGGNVGIGITAPAATLHVSGTLQIANGTTLQGSATLNGGLNVTAPTWTYTFTGTASTAVFCDVGKHIHNSTH
jgi:hypothetical protein